MYGFPRQSLIIRAAGDPRAIASAVEATVLALDKDQPVQNIRPLTGIIAESISDMELRSSYLDKVPEHRAIAAAWAARCGTGRAVVN